jgi:hypothetical protein
MSEDAGHFATIEIMRPLRGSLEMDVEVEHLVWGEEVEFFVEERAVSCRGRTTRPFQGASLLSAAYCPCLATVLRRNLRNDPEPCSHLRP